jgi:hypothetical protein
MSKHCGNVNGERMYTSMQQAQKDCSADSTCGGVYNDACANGRFFMCQGSEVKDSVVASCIYVKEAPAGGSDIGAAVKLWKADHGLIQRIGHQTVWGAMASIVLATAAIVFIVMRKRRRRREQELNAIKSYASLMAAEEAFFSAAGPVNGDYTPMIQSQQVVADELE